VIGELGARLKLATDQKENRLWVVEEEVGRWSMAHSEMKERESALQMGLDSPHVISIHAHYATLTSRLSIYEYC